MSRPKINLNKITIKSVRFERSYNLYNYKIMDGPKNNNSYYHKWKERAIKGAVPHALDSYEVQTSLSEKSRKTLQGTKELIKSLLRNPK
jgi:hypothetical protein